MGRPPQPNGDPTRYYVIPGYALSDVQGKTLYVRGPATATSYNNTSNAQEYVSKLVVGTIPQYPHWNTDLCSVKEAPPLPSGAIQLIYWGSKLQKVAQYCKDSTNNTSNEFGFISGVDPKGSGEYSPLDLQLSPPLPPPCLSIDTDRDGVSSCTDCNDNDRDLQYSCPPQPTVPAEVPPDLNQGAPDSCQDPAFAGNPINILTGNKYEFKEDLRLPTPHRNALAFSRAYNSQATTSSILGYGWTHNYAVSIKTDVQINGITHIQVVDATGKAFYFTKSNNSRWDGTFHEKSFIAVESIGGYTWYRQDGFIYSFDAQRKVRWIDDPSGNRQALTYTNNLLDTVTDGSSGRKLKFHYKPAPNSTLLDHITGPVASDILHGQPLNTDGRLVTYNYDDYDNLTSVTYDTDGSVFIYEYNDPNEAEPKHHLTAKKDKKNIQERLISSWAYDTQGRAHVSTTRDDHDVTIAYPTTTPPITTKVTDAYGKVRTYTITKKEGLFPRVDTVSGSGGCGDCLLGRPVSYFYDKDLRVTEERYADGRIDSYQNFDANGNPQTVTLAAGSQEVLPITYTYHLSLGTPLTITFPSVIKENGSTTTTWDYDDPQATDDTDTANEHPTNQVYRLIEEGYTMVGGTVAHFNYKTLYQYNDRGQVMSVDGPFDDDTMTFSYDETNGDLYTVNRQSTDGTITPIITFINNYCDAAGNPWKIVDRNNKLITLGYDGRNRLTSYQIGGATQSKIYIQGDITTFTSLTGRQLNYAYDANTDPNPGLLSTVTDRFANYIKLGRGGEGNVIAESIYKKNPNPNLADIRVKYQRYSYQEPTVPGRLWKITNPNGSATYLGYDAVGHVNSVKNPLDKTTNYHYDKRGRVDNMIQPGEVITKYGYDAHSNLISVTDPDLDTVPDSARRKTSYIYDDYGRLLSITSPDTGTTTYRYDMSNNSMTITDAKAVTRTYQYDGESRLKAVTFPTAPSV